MSEARRQQLRRQWESEPATHCLNMDYVLTGTETKEDFLRKIQLICNEWVQAMHATRHAVTRSDLSDLWEEAYTNGLTRYKERQRELTGNSPGSTNGEIHCPKVFEHSPAVNYARLTSWPRRDFHFCEFQNLTLLHRILSPTSPTPQILSSMLLQHQL